MLAVSVGDQLQALAHRILRQPDLAEDATQQALLAVWRELPMLRDATRFEPWARRILVRACQAELRRSRRWNPRAQLNLDTLSAPDGTASIADRDQLERAFGRLSVEHRAVVALRYYLDLPIEGVAESLGIPVGTARSRLHYAVKALRAAVDADARSAVREAVR